MYDYFKKTFNKKPSIGELNTDGISDEFKKTFNKLYQNSTISYTKAKDLHKLNKELFIKLPVIQNLSNFLLGFSKSTYKSYRELFISKERNHRFPTGTCLPFSKKMFITVNGKLLPCESVSHEHSLGQVTDTEVKLEFSEILNKYNEYYRKMYKLCSSCNINDTCTQCMLYDINITEKKISCSNYMNNERFNNYLSSYISFLEKFPELYYEIMTKIITI